MKKNKLLLTLVIVFSLFSTPSLAYFSSSGAFSVGNLYIPPQTKYVPQEKEVEVVTDTRSVDLMTDCRAPDLRPFRNDPNAGIAFPISNNTIPNSGNIKISVIAIDFKDAIGNEKPSTIIEDQMNKIDEWMQWYSNGKVTITWNFNDLWVRAFNESSNYIIPHPLPGMNQPHNYQPIVKEYIYLAEEHYDLSGTDALLFIYPETATKIKSEMNGTVNHVYSKTLTTPSVYAMITGTNLYTDRYKNNFWSWIIHELLHPMGMSGHTPSNAYMGMMHVNSGWSQALNSWDAMTLGWADSEDIYCIKEENIKSNKIKLSAIEKEEAGFSSVMVRVSKSEVLIAESHRPDKWAIGMDKLALGVMVYIVDTTKNHDHGENFNAIDTTARFLQPDNTPIIRNDWSSSDYMMKKNQTLTYKNIKISVIDNKINDILLLERL